MAEKKSGKTATNIDNLKPLTTSRAREIGKMGGKASAKARQERKTFKEVFNTLLPMQVNDDKISGLISVIKEINPNMTAEQAIAVAQIYKAINGDTQSAIFVRDTVGEKPVEKKETDLSVKEIPQVVLKPAEN